MKRVRYIVTAVLLPLCLMTFGQDEPQGSNEPQYSANKSGADSKGQSKVYTGFSGGMMVHIGYAFSQSPDQLFGNSSLADVTSNLSSSGVTIGLGGALRIHLLDHIHLGGEGHVSVMPLMKSGSNIRTGWGGALCDYYFHTGKAKPLLGMLVGGGAMTKLYVPEEAEVVEGDEANYNASYTKTSYFLLDPYVGVEVELGAIDLLIKMDYALPFGSSKSILSQDVSWGNFLTPSGPRLYVGVLFGH